MDFDILVHQGVITQATRNWLEPQWQKEQAEAKELKETIGGGGIFDSHDDDNDDIDPVIHDEDHLIPRTITIRGVKFSYCQDDRSVGHGNRVWHSSIATCFYLQGLVESTIPTHVASTLQVMELGAGTALPSLFLAQILAKQDNPSGRPFLHVTDSHNFRNIQQILGSIGQQSTTVRDRIHFRVSPHNWGEGIGVGEDEDGSFFQNESLGKEPNRYEIVIVSDCIYNPNYHASLLESIARMLKLPDSDGTSGGRAIVSFSLHGNTNNETIWNFLELTNAKQSPDHQWRLQAEPVTDLYNDGPSDNSVSMEYVGRGGWNMEDTMKNLDLWAANLDPQRWIAHLYEVTWTKME